MGLLKKENISSSIDVENWDIMQIIVLTLKRRTVILHIVVNAENQGMLLKNIEPFF